MNEPFRFDVLTLFPEILDGFLGESILKRALQNNLIEVHRWNVRDWSPDQKHHKVDDRPFGGGPGMVLMPEPVVAAVEAVQAIGRPGHLIMLTPVGERLTQRVVRDLAARNRLILLCGRYEGFDERIRLTLKPREISVGDFVCNGGEVPAMLVIEAVMRLLPGVLGDETSASDESHAEPGRLEYPHYTRPREFRGLQVPEILLSGDHAAIARWRQEKSALRSRPESATNDPTPGPERTDDHEKQAHHGC